jgi:Mn2+/Fe2+ NRAMP family transporter
MVTGVPSSWCTAIYAMAIVTLLFYFPYRKLQRIFKWLCLILFAYIAAGFLARPDWHAVLISTLLPRLEWSGEYLSVLVAIMGATKSPYFITLTTAATLFAQGRKEINTARKLPPRWRQ